MQKTNNMGVGSLANPKTIFVRTFRWTFASEGLSEQFVKQVNFHFKQKTIDLQAYEVFLGGDNKVDLLMWLDNDPKEAVFTTYDGCGTMLYRYHFKGLKLVKDDCEFDYSSSEVATHMITLTYETMEREFLRESDVLPEDGNAGNTVKWFRKYFSQSSK